MYDPSQHNWAQIIVIALIAIGGWELRKAISKAIGFSAGEDLVLSIIVTSVLIGATVGLLAAGGFWSVLVK